MNNQEIYSLLRERGFRTEKTSFGVIVSLNRPITFQEVEEALDHQIEQSEFIRISDNQIFISSTED